MSSATATSENAAPFDSPIVAHSNFDRHCPEDAKPTSAVGHAILEDQHRSEIQTTSPPGLGQQKVSQCRKRSRPCPPSPSASESDEGYSSSTFSFTSSSQSLLARDDSPPTSAASSPYSDHDDHGRSIKSKKVCSSRPASLEPAPRGLGTRGDDTNAVASTSNDLLRSASSVATEQSDADVTGLGGAVEAFGLREKSASPAQPSTASPSTKVSLADHLVDAAVATIDAIWKSPVDGILSSEMGSRCEMAGSFPLHLFVRETLRRSRTSCSALQAALLYCVKSASKIRAERYRFQRRVRFIQRPGESLASAAERVEASVAEDGAAPFKIALLCNRRFFLAALISATKFLQDKNFSNRAWSKITGLPVKQLGEVERAFLATIEWDLFIAPGEWEGWTRKLAEFKSEQPQAPAAHAGGLASVASSPLTDVNVASGPATPTAASAPRMLVPNAKTMSALPDAVRRLRRSPSPISRRSGSSTPTPSTVKASSSVNTPMRSILSRSHSDDSAFVAFDSAIPVPPTPQANQPLAASAEMVRGQANCSSVLSSEMTVPGVMAQSPSVPAPFPMPRSFVRSGSSFSSAMGTSSANRLSVLKQEHH